VRFRPASVSGRGRQTALEVTLRTPAVEVVTRGDAAEVAVRRFAAAYGAPIGRVQPDRRGLIRIPSDLATQPWHVQLAGDGDILACGAR
jgi:hypothetical protein